MDRKLLYRASMNRPAFEALRRDVEDVAAALHLLADGARGRGDADTGGALRLIARHVEAVQEQVEQLAEDPQ
ncbi:MAG: hypothetical protein ACHQWU_09110 [Gemmatimonadales bacterium]